MIRFRRSVLLSTVAVLSIAGAAQAQTATSSNTVSSFDRERGHTATATTTTAKTPTASGLIGASPTTAHPATTATGVPVATPAIAVPAAGNFQRNTGVTTAAPATATPAAASNIHATYPGLKAVQGGPASTGAAAAVSTTAAPAATGSAHVSSFDHERGKTVSPLANPNAKSVQITPPPSVESTTK